MFDSNKKIVYQDTLDEYHKRISALIGTGGSQISTIPTASEDYENVIYQYIGDTDSTYTNGYFYKCIEDPENEGEYIWVNEQVQDGGSSGGGHEIEDSSGTSLTQRDTLQFAGDFEVNDDSTNEKTVVAPHELTNEDMAEIMSTLPSPVNDRLPVLFDEQGVERQVGWYVNSSGLRKPVYEKSVVWTGSVAKNNYVLIGTIANVDVPIDVKGFIRDRNTVNNHQLGASGWSGVNFQTSGAIYISTYIDYGEGSEIRAIVHYTKTTDTFQ